MESWSFPFINDEARRFAKHRIAQVIRYGERGAEDYRYSSAIDYAGGKGLLDVMIV